MTPLGRFDLQSRSAQTQCTTSCYPKLSTEGICCLMCSIDICLIETHTTVICTEPQVVSSLTSRFHCSSAASARPHVIHLVHRNHQLFSLWLRRVQGLCQKDPNSNFTFSLHRVQYASGAR